VATGVQIVFDCADPDALARGWGTPDDERRRRVDAEVDRVARLGARKSRTVEERGGYFVNMFDPEGNEFDVH
jgi:Glyoxalase-like domain